MIKLRDLWERIKVYTKLLRFFTLVAPVVGGSFVGLMALRVESLDFWSHLHLLFLSCFVLAMTNAVSNILNQIHDRKLDLVIPHKRGRPIPAGRVSLDNALGIVFFLTVAILALAFSVFGVYYGILLSVILVFSWMYSSPPFRLRARLIWGNLAISTPRGMLGVMTAYAAFSNPLDFRILLLGLALASYVFGANTFKDYEDVEGDRKMGIRNFCTVLGKRKASMLIMPFLYVPFIIFALGSALHMLPLLPLSVAISLILYRNPTLKRKGYWLWVLFYTQLSAMIAVYTIPYIV